MEPTLMIIGVNCRTAPLEVCERFRINPERRRDVLQELRRAEGVDEIMLLATACRTEFILWTSDACAAAGSVLNFLSRAYSLRLSDWQHFYRMLEKTALAHLLGIVSSVAAGPVSESEMIPAAKTAWNLARDAGTTGSFLDVIMETALAVAASVGESSLSPAQAQAMVSQQAKALYAALRQERVARFACATRT